ncbi:unnamed protein product [Ambrosiozyma monospora]|uniref:Unnamed protein product n=1 Tax=Ambrosiozyma monospora TaxID=43982 RepID=A0ACB5SVQ1_AMBMO|nr:unnamed protein product [Ambrosiozyma monospora]
MNIWPLLSICQVIFAIPVTLPSQISKTSDPTYESTTLTEQTTVNENTKLVPKRNSSSRSDGNSTQLQRNERVMNYELERRAPMRPPFPVSLLQIPTILVILLDYKEPKKLMNIELERRQYRIPPSAVSDVVASTNAHDSNELPPAAESIVAPPSNYQQAVNDKLIDAGPQKVQYN